MMEIVVVCSLILLLVIQNFFWSVQVQKLVNKLMSRNYGEYQQLKSFNEESKMAPIQTEDPSEFEDLRRIGG